MTKLRVMGRDGYYPLGSEKILKVKNHISVPSFSSSHPPLMKCDISKQIDGWKTINAMYVSPEKSWHESDPPPFWVVAKIAAVVSSEGALVAVPPYDYTQQRPLFEHTPVLDNNFSINAMKTLVTMITMIAKIT